VEAAGQALWLFDLQLPDGLTRVGRYTAMRLYAARPLEYTYDKVRPPDQLQEFGTLSGRHRSSSGAVGAHARPNRRNDVIGNER